MSVQNVADRGEMWLRFSRSVMLLGLASTSTVLIYAMVHVRTLAGYSATPTYNDFAFSVSAIVGGIFALCAFALAYAQMHLLSTQIGQARELADRKDDALISAIESLTRELKRRPAPNPSVVNFSLFGPWK